jgi:hypothetical protein
LTLGLDDGSSAITLLARLDDTGASVALPDRALTGLIDMNVTWADSCFTYGGSARLAVEIVPSAAADACPDAAGIMDQVRASQDVEVELAGARAGLGTLAWQARFLPGNGADAVPAFAGFDPDRPPAVADAGEVVPLRILDPGFALVGAALTIYERDDVVDATGHLMDVVAEPTRMTVTVGADGLVGIPFPTEPGQYVVAIEVSWERPCVVGEGLLYLSLIAG